MSSWRNWAGNVTSAPQEVHRPDSLAELAGLVRGAAQRGQLVKMVGSGHSFSPIAQAPGILILPRAQVEPVELDPIRRTVRAAADTPLWSLNQQLALAGWSLHNMGDIDRQTLAGAVSTGTHGSGGCWASLSAQLVGLELIDGNGELRILDAHRHPEEFAAARVGLGALGIVTHLTFRIEEMFGLAALEQPVSWSEFVTNFDAFVTSNQHTDSYWFPHTDRVLAKSANRLASAAALQPLSKANAWLADEFLANTVFGAVVKLGNLRAGLIPGLNRLSSATFSSRRYRDQAPAVFVSPRRVRFKELEYALDRAHAGAVLRQTRELIERHRLRIGFPIEIRTSPPESGWLATSYGQESVYLAFHVPYQAPHEPYFSLVEELMTSFGGRPHWGKLHSLTASALATRYPRFADFLAIRDAFDPQRVFTNEYLRRVLGA